MTARAAAGIEARGLGKRRGDRWVVDDVTFIVEPGEVVALGGGNGAGKTTILALVAGVLEPDRGWVLVAGAGPGRRRQLGYVPEAADPPGHLTGGELLALCAALRGAPPLDDDTARLLDIAALADRRFDRMSLGQRRRVCLAAALVGAPSALVLDEPDNGLDAAGLAALVTLVERARQRGAAVLVATHDPAIKDRLATRALTLEAGHLISPA